MALERTVTTPPGPDSWKSGTATMVLYFSGLIDRSKLDPLADWSTARVQAPIPGR